MYSKKMMFVKRLILSVFVIVGLLACSSDDNGGDIGGGDPNNDDIFITFKANGTSYTMEPYSAASMKVNIGASQGADDTHRGITLSMPLDYATGSHQLTDSFEIDAYTASFSSGDISADAISGTLVITSITADYIEGTFHFTTEESDGVTFNITEGSFKAYNL